MKYFFYTTEQIYSKKENMLVSVFLNVLFKKVKKKKKRKKEKVMLLPLSAKCNAVIQTDFQVFFPFLFFSRFNEESNSSCILYADF